VGRQVLLAGIVEDGREGVAFHGLERVADARAGVAIIDDQRRAAERDDSLCDRANGFVAGGRAFDNLAVTVEGEAVADCLDVPLDPADVLANRQRVEELVGNEEDGSVTRKVTDVVVVDGAGDRLELSLAEGGAGLDEVHCRVEAGRAHDADCIAGERASAGAKLSIDGVRR
jgi:hypothetical protein